MIASGCFRMMLFNDAICDAGVFCADTSMVTVAFPFSGSCVNTALVVSIA